MTQRSSSEEAVADATSPPTSPRKRIFGLGVVVAAFLSAPTFAIWRLAFLNAKPAWRKDDDAAEGAW